MVPHQSISFISNTMFTNLTSYIFGSKSDAEEAVDATAAPEETRNGQVGGDPKKQEQEKPAEEQGDWVLLDEDDDEIVDDGEMDGEESSSPPATPSNNPRSNNGTAIGTVCAAGACAAKAQKAARAAFLKRSAKGLTAKKSEKQNRVMKSGNAGGKRAAVKHNLPIKSAGCKVLKQC